MNSTYLAGGTDSFKGAMQKTVIETPKVMITPELWLFDERLLLVTQLAQFY